MTTRRDLLLSAAAAGATAIAPASMATAAGAGDGDAGLGRAFDGLAAHWLDLDPQQATSLGLDKGSSAPLKARLNDASRAGFERRFAYFEDMKAQLAAAPDAALSFDFRTHKAVLSWAAFSAAAVSSGSRSREPIACTRQGLPSAANSLATPAMMRSNGSSSLAGRFRLSVDSSQMVTWSTPASRHQVSRLEMCRAPWRCPSLTSSNPAALAHRRFPSIMIATCRGVGSPVRVARRRRS